MDDFYDGIYFLCTLIERIGRDTKLQRYEIVEYLNPKGVDKVIELHTTYDNLTLEQVSHEFIEEFNIPCGNYNSIPKYLSEDCNVPSEFSIGMSLHLVLKELNVNRRNIYKLLDYVYRSKVVQKMPDYTTDIYTASTDYLVNCIKDNKIYIM